MEDKIRVVVTGEFASGKSTLLNVLLGGEAMEKRLLPDTITIVGIPRRIVNGAYDGRVYLERETADGLVREELSEEEYRKRESDLCSQDGYPRPGYRASFYCPLRDPSYEFTELPPVGSWELTEYRDIFEEADAIIYIRSAMHSLSKYGREFFETCRRFTGEKVQNVFCVLNHWRIVGAEDQEAVKEKIRFDLTDLFRDNNGFFDEELYEKRVFFVDMRGRTMKGEEVPPLGLEKLEASLYGFLDQVSVRRLRDRIRRLSEFTDELLKEEEILRRYSLERLREGFEKLTERLCSDIGEESVRCQKEAEQIITVAAQEGERMIMRGIESQTSILGLNAYTKKECPEIMNQMARTVAAEIDRRINIRLQMLAEGCVQEVERYLAGFQEKIGEITVDAELFSQKVSFENMKFPVFNLLSYGNPSNEIVLYMAGAMLEGLSGSPVTRFMLPMKQEAAQQKLREAMAEFTAKLRQESAVKLREIPADFGKWLGELRGGCEYRYGVYFAAAERKQKERAQAVRQEIQANLSCLRELEQTEGVL